MLLTNWHVIGCFLIDIIFFRWNEFFFYSKIFPSHVRIITEMYAKISGVDRLNRLDINGVPTNRRSFSELDII